jgi:hypothetical protein
MLLHHKATSEAAVGVATASVHKRCVGKIMPSLGRGIRRIMRKNKQIYRPSNVYRGIVGNKRVVSFSQTEVSTRSLRELNFCICNARF